MPQIPGIKYKTSANSYYTKRKEIPSWFAPSIVGFWFIGLFITWNAYYQTEITFIETLKWFLFFALTGTLIPHKLILKFIWLDYTYWITSNIVGIGPLLTGIFLTINLTITDLPTTKTYQIIQIHYPESIEYTETIVSLENNELQDHPKFRTFDYHDVKYHKSITYHFTTGYFGYRIIEKSEIN
jgi:hypothetical protein